MWGRKKNNILSDLAPLTEEGYGLLKTHFPLETAALCPDCETVFPQTRFSCPSCTSSSSIPLRWHGRERPRPKIAVLGWGRAGKDTFAAVVASQTALRYSPDTGSTSTAILREMEKRPEYVGLTREQVYERRLVDRDLWYAVGREICSTDPAQLVKDCLSYGDIVTGIRSREELATVRSEGLVDVVVWISAERRVSQDSSCRVSSDDCDLSVDNNGTLDDFLVKSKRIAKLLL
mgnify:FL=1